MRDTLPDPSNPTLRRANNTAGTRNEIQTPAERRYEGLKPLEAEQPQIQVIEDLEPEAGIRSFIAEAAAAKMRCLTPTWLASSAHQPRARAAAHRERPGHGQRLRRQGKHKLRGGEQIEPSSGQPQFTNRRAEPGKISKSISSSTRTMTSPASTSAAGMTVHAGAVLNSRIPRHRS